MPLELRDLAALDAPAAATGEPLRIALALIDEDPEQPRRAFDDNALQELAQTIARRGVRQPISVRPHPVEPGRWMLNFGARRLRASKLAGLTDIPAFVDTTADSYDQVIENEQRQGLSPMELALFVQKRLAGGDTQADIARGLSKSRQYITLATALIEPPEWLLQAYRAGRCKGLTELYELRRLHAQHPQYVEAWASDQEDAITRERIGELRADLMGQGERPAVEATAALMQAIDAEVPALSSDAGTVAATTPKATRGRAVHVELDGQDFQLVVTAAPEQPGHVFVRPLAGGPRRTALASALKLRGFVGRR